MMVSPRSILRIAAEIVFIGLPGRLLIRLWSMVIAEQLKPKDRCAI